MKHWFVICVKHCCLCEASPKINGISNFQDLLTPTNNKSLFGRPLLVSLCFFYQICLWVCTPLVPILLQVSTWASPSPECSYLISNFPCPRIAWSFYGQPPLSFVQCKTPHQCITVVQSVLHCGSAVFLICTCKFSAVYLYLVADARASSGQGLLTSTTCCVIFIVPISLPLPLLT